MAFIKRHKLAINKKSDLCVRDRNGTICHRGDILYDKLGNKYIFQGVEYIVPHSFFQRIISIGKAGYKAILDLRASEDLHYADTIFVEPEWVQEWYAHNKFGKKTKTS